MFKYYISALYLSLFSREFYRDLIGNKKIYGLRYILLLALILGFPVSLQIKYMMNDLVGKDVGVFHKITEDEIENEVKYISSQMPDIIFEKNNFKSGGSEPSYIYSGNKDLVAVIDTERKLKEIPQENLLMLKDNELEFIAGGVLSAVVSAVDIYQSFSNYFELNIEGKPELNEQRLLKDIYLVITTPFPVIYIFCFLWLTFKYFFKIIIYSFISGMIFSLMLKTESFDFKLCIRTAVFTATPVAVLEFLSFSLGQNFFVHVNLVYFITHIIYIYFAVESYKRKQPKHIV